MKAAVSTSAPHPRSNAPAAGLSEPTPTTSIPSRPCSLSRIACRLVPLPEARTTTRNSATSRLACGNGCDALERELAVRLVGIAERIVAAEAGVAVVAGVAADRLVDARHREVGERVGLELVGDLLDRAVVGDHLLARGHVDAVVAGVANRRRRDPQVHLAGAGLAQHADDLPRRVAAHDRVIDDDEALPGDDLRQRVELHPQAVFAQLLAGLDEGPRHIAVLDQAVVAGDRLGAGKAGRRRVARVR